MVCFIDITVSSKCGAVLCSCLTLLGVSNFVTGSSAAFLEDDCGASKSHTRNFIRYYVVKYEN